MSDQVGSKWWKIDFHVHTPASRDYKEDGVTAKDWLRAAMEQELDAVVVADHNSGGWIDELKSAYAAMKQENASGFRELTIFPGFELSVNGGNRRFHLLGIFDPSTSRDGIHAVLAKCNISADDYGSVHVSSELGFVQAAKTIRAMGGIPVPAHANSPRGDGILTGCDSLPEDLRITLEEFNAAEFCEMPNYSDYELKKAVKRLAVLGGSDAHVTRANATGSGHSAWIGKYYVWVKMGAPTIDALRMALCDPQDCVRSDGPAPEADFRLVRLSVQNLTDITGESYCDKLECGFAPAMTALIGGRGSGKSTVSRCVRNVFRRPPEAEGNSDINLQWENFMHGVLSATLEVEFLMLGRRYRLLRQGNEEQVKEYNNGVWEDAELGDVRTRFPITVFGQKEVGELARRPDGLLALIDEAGDTKGGGWKDEWEKHSSNYLSLRIRERELEQQVSQLPDVKVELADLERNIAAYERKGGGQVLKSFQERSRQNLALSVSEEIGGGQGWSARIRALSEGFVVPEFPSELFAEDDATLQEIKNVYESYARRLLVLRDTLAHHASEVENIVGEFIAERNGTAWRRAFDAAVAAYDNLRNENGGELHVEDYGAWVAKRNQLVERVRILELAKIELEKTRADAVTEQNKLEVLREELKAKRQKFVDSTLSSNALVKMTVRKFADRTRVESRLRTTLGVSNDWQSQPIKELLAPIMDWSSNAQSTTELAVSLKELKDKMHKVVKGTASVTQWFDRKTRDCWAENPAVFDAFDIWWPEDNVEVEYSMDDGTGFRPLTAGASAGQKATAMLAFLLSYGTNPILIDQPEDDIDNRLITKLLVQQLRENKNRRQVIVMTHNPNVVVNGGAESVVVMNFTEGKVSCHRQGSIDCAEIKKDICDIMEGGCEAFRNRYNRELGGEDK